MVVSKTFLDPCRGGHLLAQPKRKVVWGPVAWVVSRMVRVELLLPRVVVEHIEARGRRSALGTGFVLREDL